MGTVVATVLFKILFSKGLEGDRWGTVIVQ